MESWLKNLLTQIDEATAKLIATANGLTDKQVSEPSLLPGWTRGHVLTHIARAAEAHRNLLNAARTGTDIPAYTSQEARDASIENGASRPVAEQVADIERTAAAFRAAVDATPDDAWTTSVTILHLAPFPASQVVLRKLVELELHHVDLNAGYRPTDWPVTFKPLELPEPMRSQAADRISWLATKYSG
ncbi:MULTISPECIES: maleylpyruvate isomerase N-terminal domain-containing protein [unclassified Streptomyces]|uniref:maleylpyruvate isomerase N-terminal domain-containing protein n=1 Tax=unclassified Streptomyces TaxID=2593676 RepID=UPI00168B9790|nr:MULTISPECIES: maleylpyruvate isomerase N-terminal domain-containing protein [unclassified Streptomyces]MBD3009524.1 maleylpyruvate isomerase N-terminal domain-containing protein [Streptomyces sp. 5-10]